MAVLSQFEYRFNLFTDAILQPMITAAIEVTLWWAIFKSANLAQIGGFTSEYYLDYALWAAFFARISISWMYEFMMIDEIDSGRVNAILVRPISFYEFYLGQFYGYKLLTSALSLMIPIVVTSVLHTVTDLSRLPLALALVLYYLLLIHTMSYAISAMAFFYNRIHALPVAKNIAIWLLSGELFPLDLVPAPFQKWVIALPFSSGVYLPVGFMTHRFEADRMWTGFLSITAGIVVIGGFGKMLWFFGRRAYAGQGT